MGVTCPKCGFHQEGPEECLRCGIIFRKYKPLPSDQPSRSEAPRLRVDVAGEDGVDAAADAPLGTTSPPSGTGWVARAWRIFPWLSLTAMIVVLALILRTAPPLQIEMDPQALARVDHKMQELHVAAHHGEPYTLILDEAELNAWLQANLALSEGQSPYQVSGLMPTTNIPADDPRFQETQGAMKDLRVNLVGETVRAYAVFGFYGQDMSLLLEGKVRAEDGYLRFTPTDAKLGSLPIPSVTLDRVATRLFESPESRDSFQLSPHISTVDIRKGRLFVAFR